MNVLWLMAIHPKKDILDLIQWHPQLLTHFVKSRILRKELLCFADLAIQPIVFGHPYFEIG